MRRRVAITGLGVVSPVGSSCADFFDALLHARSGLRSIEVPFPSGSESVVLGPVDFQADQHYSRAKLITLDRVSQLAGVAARQAMTQARLGDAQQRLAAYDSERFGVCVGNANGGSCSVDAAYTELIEHKAAHLRPMTVVLSMNNASAAHVGMDFQLRGPSCTVANACASSAIAIGQAFQHIRHGYADAMLAGGAEALLNRGVVKAWQAMQTLARPHPDGADRSCRPFSADRTGLVLAEGAGMLVLEEWDSAQRRGATILAELAGYGVTTDAHHLTQPQAATQAAAMRLALADAQLAPSDIGYLNAHGTATDVGDVVETQSIKQAFGALAAQLPISSTKALHGHAMGASGAIEFIASVLALGAGQLPPTAFLEQPDARCDLDYIANVSRTAHNLRAVISNSFAFGGTNAVLVAKSYSQP